MGAAGHLSIREREDPPSVGMPWERRHAFCRNLHAGTTLKSGPLRWPRGIALMC